MREYAFYVYIVTNPEKTVLYTGMTNDLVRRLQEHYESRGQPEKFAGKYYCHRLIYWGESPVRSQCHRPRKGDQGLAERDENGIDRFDKPRMAFSKR